MEHTKTGTKIKFCHNNQNKIAYVTKKNSNEKGETLYTFTSTLKNGRKILTHIEEGVTEKYLLNKGITLSKDF